MQIIFATRRAPTKRQENNQISRSVNETHTHASNVKQEQEEEEEEEEKEMEDSERE